MSNNKHKYFTMKKILLIIAATVISVQFAQAQQKKFTEEQLNDVITFAAVDPLQKVFKETAFFEETEAIADVARGEHASFQFALRSTRTLKHVTATVIQLSRNMDLLSKNAFVGFVGYTRVGRPLPNPSKDKLSPVSGFFPDPILDTTSMDIRNFTTQPVWITVNIPVDFPPGDYTGLLTIKGNLDGESFSLNRRFTVRVYNVTINKTSLLVTNWFGLGKNQLKQLSGGKDSVEFSDSYWKWLHVAAKKMKEYDQNVIMTPVFSLTGITIHKDSFFFDFSKFDKFVQTFIDEGTLARIEGGHIGGRMGNWYAQFGVYTPYLKNDSLKFKNLAINENEAKNFYKQFIPALAEHLKKKGWDKIYMQHVCDEPEPGNEKTYADIASYIKSVSPDIKLIDAVHSHGVNNTVDVWVPELEMYDSNYAFYQERQKAGNEVWFYTCLSPQGEYANRFIELPLIKTRILHWINFRFGADRLSALGMEFLER